MTTLRPPQQRSEPPEPPEHSAPSAWSRLATLPAGRRSKYAVLLAVTALLALATPVGGQIEEVEENGPTSMLPRGFGSTQVEEELAGFERDGVMPTAVVYSSGDGDTIDDADLQVVEADRTEFGSLAAGEVAPAQVSEDGSAVLVLFGYDMQADFEGFERIREISDDGLSPGLTALVTGPSANQFDFVAVFGEDLDVLILLISVSIVAVLLLLTYRSPVLWLLPLISIGIATVLSQAVIYLLAKHADLPVDGQSGGVLPIVLFGVGTDYALLLIARYREELHLHTDRHRAMGVALRRSVAPIAASGATVALAMSCLLLADMNSTRSLGGVAAIGVACAAVSILVVLPLLLVLLGRWVFWPKVPRADHEGGAADEVVSGRGHWQRVADLVSGRPRAIWVGTAAALAALSLGWFSTTLGATPDQSFRDTPDSVAGQTVLAEHFDAGSSTPADVVVDADAATAAQQAVAEVPGVDSVRQAATSSDGSRALLSLTTAYAPESEQAEALVAGLRDRLGQVEGADAIVGGAVAQRVDVESASAQDARTVIPAVFGVVLLVLMLLLRAVVGPVVLLATVMLSYAAAMGGGALLLGMMGFDAMDVSTPLIAFVFLVALGVDYTIFLMSRVREETELHGHGEGVRRGLVATGGVITSAGIVLAATFSVLLGMPIVFTIGMGAVIALGILLDTFVIRSLLVPALTLDIGPRFWAPGAVARRERSRTLVDS